MFPGNCSSVIDVTVPESMLQRCICRCFHVAVAACLLSLFYCRCCSAEFVAVFGVILSLLERTKYHCSIVDVPALDLSLFKVRYCLCCSALIITVLLSMFQHCICRCCRRVTVSVPAC